VSTQHAVVKTAVAEALKTVATHPLFPVLFKGRTQLVKAELVSALMVRIKGTDPGAQVVAAEAMRSQALLPYLRDSLATLQVAQQRLKLPRDVEVFDAFQAAADVATGTVSAPRKPSIAGTFNPKDLLAYKQPVRVLVDTDKGKFTIELDPTVAPASVLSFIRLAKTGYYDNKTWHRVVGSFVAQTGCSAGDGYSGMDFSLRSEFSPGHYLEPGMVGLASAGAHTESAQWFVTLAPALHLDGRYTPFGRVVEGMDVVFQLLVGDSVKKVLVL
jgi:cyclophilin family peptidyl-prolyl cis-trans isomerase